MKRVAGIFMLLLAGAMLVSTDADAQKKKAPPKKRNTKVKTKKPAAEQAAPLPPPVDPAIGAGC